VSRFGSSDHYDCCPDREIEEVLRERERTVTKKGDTSIQQYYRDIHYKTGMKKFWSPGFYPSSGR
jgi:hypothetical protein